ncbi:hypothetical protein BABINDRAFT_159243 [Babjeviella inositovora NRRL Y-12698]|uniref:Uncharacterized protein n=1 Tax=Babjeviella inositovora NRRL Y-12698 TaxID=984486 RepID=A0A1E3QYG0_9ASCO|nr:uncharacterized protein BABINDRAFT_159243 [Babjeviella inositovora NRRL Y-12698]ODQ82719.1 hypothetical protein BABINDRAFT_159243 [Babjeviella inositovora NRRL Y-12698]
MDNAADKMLVYACCVFTRSFVSVQPARFFLNHKDRGGADNQDLGSRGLLTCTRCYVL